MAPKSAPSSLFTLAKKGEASPTPINDTPAPDSSMVTVEHAEALEVAPAVVKPAGQGRAVRAAPARQVAAAAPAAPLQGVKSLTVKLDAERYNDLVTVGFYTRRSNQEMMVEAFDLWIAKNRVVQG